MCIKTVTVFHYDYPVVDPNNDAPLLLFLSSSMPTMKAQNDTSQSSLCRMQCDAQLQHDFFEPDCLLMSTTSSDPSSDSFLSHAHALAVRKGCTPQQTLQTPQNTTYACPQREQAAGQEHQQQHNELELDQIRANPKERLLHICSCARRSLQEGHSQLIRQLLSLLCRHCLVLAVTFVANEQLFACAVWCVAVHLR